MSAAPNSDGKMAVQPRMQAWLISLNRPISLPDARKALSDLGFWQFSMFIADCKRLAERFGLGVLSGNVVNQDQFTDCCMIEARWRSIGASLALVPAKARGEQP